MQLDEALAHQSEYGGRLGFNPIKIGSVKDEEITAYTSCGELEASRIQARN